MNWAVFCDLTSNNITFSMYRKAIEDLDGTILYEKLYGYTSKNRDFKEYIKMHQVDVCFPKQSRRKTKIDVRQCIDIAMYILKSNIEGIFIVCSPIDASYLFKIIKNNNIQIAYAGEYCAEIEQYIDKHITLDRNRNLEFLPYSGIESSKNELKEIKEKIDSIIDKKLNNKDIEFQSSEEIAQLLKKYF